MHSLDVRGLAIASNFYKTLTFAFIIVIVCAIIYRHLPRLTSKGSPPQRLMISEAQRSFGEAFEGQSVRHRFSIVNQSGDEVQEIHLKASCSCTSIEPLKSAEDHTWHEFEISVTVSEPGNVTYRPRLQIVPMNDVDAPLKLALPIQAYGLDGKLAQRAPEKQPQ